MTPTQIWGLLTSLRSLIDSLTSIERDDPKLGRGIRIAVLVLLVAFLVVPLIRRPRAKKTAAK